MTTDYIPEELLWRLMDCMCPGNAVALMLMVATGMRIGDALNQRLIAWSDVLSGVSSSMQYRESKTGKDRVIRVPAAVAAALRTLPRGKSPWLFPGRYPERPRTRQAVYKDLNRVAKLYRVNGKKIRARLGTHTARKIYAVKLYHEAEKLGHYEPLEYVRVDLNHASREVTFLYALADEISGRKWRLPEGRQISS